MSKFGSDIFIEETIRTLKQQLIEAQQAREAANQRWIAAADHAKGLREERDTLRGLLQDVALPVIVHASDGLIHNDKCRYCGAVRQAWAPLTVHDEECPTFVAQHAKERITAALKEVEG